MASKYGPSGTMGGLIEELREWAVADVQEALDKRASQAASNERRGYGSLPKISDPHTAIAVGLVALLELVFQVREQRRDASWPITER